MSDTYTPPDSNPDLYSNPSSSPPIDISNLPRPLPVLGPLTGYSSAKLTLVIQKRLEIISQTISRPLTPDETAAIAHHSARASSIASCGPSLGIGFGAYRTWATRKDFRWPLYGKIISDEVSMGFWDGEKMRLNGKEILAGVSREGKANILHAARGMAYLSAGMLVVPFVVSSYAATVVAVSELRDQRLREVTRGLRLAAEAEREERVAKIRGQRGETTTGSNATGPRGDVWRERRERREKMGGRVERQEEGVDDMSPTGGAMLDYGIDGSQGESSVMSDSQLQSQVQPSPSPYQRKQSARSSPSPSSSSYSTDDASPTSGRGMLDDTFPSTSTSSTTDSTGLSAWERIRQQNAADGNTPSPSTGQMRRGGRKARQQQQQQQEEGGDGFTFSSEEEERGYARVEAQKEFDERLERERRGGSFGGNE